MTEPHYEYSIIIDRIRKFANDHYEQGWDVIVEAYTDFELLELFKSNSVTTYKDAKRVCSEISEHHKYANENGHWEY